ncbi:serine/threonine protein kinase [Nodosilinea sp. LEGE 07088]|uniref:serine/threonine protein kinase n=1 Tax=Nodosilinea sp. LEGE 07088 TaxID=2777968 RepID=UPI0018829996|nr:serine/threonine-protein kinase [Nodosilinea sp. LEGE 07088]MBE9137517.1 serine/threonine protein kinase [Nodosilinea sp. LEGE 07088]
MELSRATNDIIDGRYRVLRCLGQGSSGTTYAAEVLDTGHAIALKELSLRGLQDWKKIELFEREAGILKTLNHPAIPRYIDAFQVDTADNRWFYLAQDLAEGTSLADWVEAGGRVNEAEARRIAAAVLDVLSYLHGLNPPVIHRDLKPQNIIRRDDGQIYLVDFGAVQTVYRDDQGSTVVGTYGYMAPEQFRGQAVPATDLYGLGATLLFVLTHQSPADLPQARLRLNFRPYLSVSAAFADWLDQLLDPLVEDRFASAQVALAALTQPAPLVPMASLRPRPPAGTRVRVQTSPTELRIAIPPVGLRGETIGLALFGLFWNGFVLFWTFGVVSGGAWWFGLFAIPFWVAGFGMIGGIINNLLAHVTLRIDRHHFSLSRRLLRWTRQQAGNTADLAKVELQTAYTQNDRPVQTITLLEGINQHKFGTPLTAIEKAWLVEEISWFLGQNGGDR